MRRRCRVCDHLRETQTAMKYGERTGHWRPASICEGCAQFALLDPPGFDLNGNRWSIRGLRKAWKIKENA